MTEQAVIGLAMFALITAFLVVGDVVLRALGVRDTYDEDGGSWL